LGANLAALDWDVRQRLKFAGQLKTLLDGVFNTNAETQRLLEPTLLAHDSRISRLAKIAEGTEASKGPVREDIRALIAGLVAE
jgi:hypothetical protein